MPYIFPRVVVRTGDVFRPDDLNASIQPAADLYGGRLDRHNFSDALDLDHFSDNVSQGNTGINHYFQATEADIEVGSPGAETPPVWPTVGGDEWPFRESLTWEPVTDLSRTVTVEGSVNLLVVATLQHLWHNYVTTSGLGQLKTVTESGKSYGVSCLFQIVVRVNGAMIIDTLVGHDNPQVKMPRPYKWRTTRDYTTSSQSDLPGVLTGYSLDIAGVGPEMLPHRLVATIPVQGGTHRVDVAIRRLLPSLGAKDLRDDVAVYNRGLYIGAINDYPNNTAASASVATAAFEHGTSLNAANLGTNGFGALAGALNAIPAGALARGAFTRRHLKSIVIAKGTHTFTTDVTGDNLYPGWSSSTITTTLLGSPGATGWYAAATATVNHVRTTKAFLLIFVDLGLREVYDTGASSLYNNAAMFFARIGMSTTVVGVPSTTLYRTSTGVVGQYNLWGDEPGGTPLRQVPEHAHVALFHAIDLTTVPDPAQTIDSISVYTACQAMYSVPTPVVEYTVARGRISWMILRA